MNSLQQLTEMIKRIAELFKREHKQSDYVLWS